MSLHVARQDAHLADDELLRFIDGEADPQQQGWAEHVGSCVRCAQEVELLRGSAGVVREWLDRAAFEDSLPPRQHPGAAGSTPRRHAPAPRRTGQGIAPWLRAAAVLALLAAPVAAVPALRQWLVATVIELRGAADTTPTALPQQDPAVPGSSAIRFVPVTGTFAVELDAAQATGVLVIRHGAGNEAVLQQTGTGKVEPVISATSLRVRNGSGSTASYHLQLPVTVDRVVIRVAAGRTVTLDAAALAAGITVDLVP
jgi:hypothetical protein